MVLVGHCEGKRSSPMGASHQVQNGLEHLALCYANRLPRGCSGRRRTNSNGWAQSRYADCNLAQCATRRAKAKEAAMGILVCLSFLDRPDYLGNQPVDRPTGAQAGGV